MDREFFAKWWQGLLAAAVLVGVLCTFALPVLADVTVGCIRGQGDRAAGIKSAVHIVQNRVVNEQQLYNNDSVWNQGTCLVQDSNRRSVKSQPAQSPQTGNVLLFIIPRSDGKHSWILRMRAIEYPAQQYLLRRRNQGSKMINAGFDTAWQPVNIYDAREWAIPRRCKRLARDMLDFSGVKMLQVSDSPMCNQVRRY